MEACPDCSRPADTVAEFAAAWVVVPIEAPLPGWAAVVAKRHGEPPEAERLRLWEDAMTAAGALTELYRPLPVQRRVATAGAHWRVELLPCRPGTEVGAAKYLRGPADQRAIGEAMRRAGAT